MNRFHRTVWNDITRTFVAVAEKVRARGKPGGSRTAPPATAGAAQRMSTGIRPMALEQRFMFDGAAVAAAVDSHAADAAAADVAAKAAAASAAAATAAAEAARTAPVEAPKEAEPAVQVHVSEPALVRDADPALNGGRREVAFVDTSVAHYQQLVDAIGPGIEVRLIDSAQNGLAQIAEWATTHSGYDALHILSHGDSGSITLGSFHLTNLNVADHQAELAQIGQALTADGDILVYGCDVGQGEAGVELVSRLSQLTQADIAASDNLTGASSLGGDWVLESSVDRIETAALHFDQYGDVLANPTVWQWGTPTMVVDQSGLVAGIPSDTFYIRPGGVTSTIIQVPANQYFAYNAINTGSAGYFEYSTNNGSTWTTLVGGWGTFAPPNSWVRHHATTTATIEVDFGAITCRNPTNSTTAANSGWYNGGGFKVKLDSAPTDIVSDNTVGYVVSDTPINSLVATLTPTDTGAGRGGYWAIDSQSSAGVFSLTSSTNTTNVAQLVLASNAGLVEGQQISVTVHYYDALQTDLSGNPINGQGISKTFTFTVRGASQDLNFGHDIAVTGGGGDTLDQIQPAITTLPNGNYVVTWVDTTGLYAQLYDSTGTAQGSRVTVDNGTTDAVPAVAALANNRFVVVYGEGTNYDLLYKIVDATTGSTVTSGVVDAYATDSNGNVTGGWDGFTSAGVAVDATGHSFVVTWGIQDYATTKVATFSDTGSQVGTSTSLTGATASLAPASIILSNGGLVTAAIDGNGFAAFNLFIGTNLVSTSAIGDSGYPASLAALSTGGFVATWVSGNQGHIYAQVFDSAGASVSSIFQVDSRGTSMGPPKVTALTDGTFVIVWESNGLDGSGYSVEGRRFTASGTAIDANEFQINEYRYGNQQAPVVTALAGGGFATAWTDTASGKSSGSDIETRVYTPPVIAPTITGVSSSTANGTYKTGDTVSIQVAFSEAVTVTGTPQLTLETGTTDRVVNYASGSGSSTLTFTYTVQAGDRSTDLDYVATTALALNGGTIQSGSGVNAALTLAAPGAAGSLGANQALVVDGIAPVITNVTIPQANYSVSTHPNDAHQVGDTVTATITVSSDADSYTLEASTVAGFALTNLVRVNATTYTATFTVTAGGTSYAAADAIPVSVVLRDTAGNLSNTYTTAIVQGDDRIDTNAPPVPGTVPTSPTLVDTAANDAFSVIAGTLSATDPEGQTLTYGIPTGTPTGANPTGVPTVGTFVVNGVTYDRSYGDAFGNTQYVNSQTGDYAYQFNAAFLNGFGPVAINTAAHFFVTDGNRSVTIDVPLSFQGANDAPVLSTDGRTLRPIDQGISDGANTGTTVTTVLASAGTATDAEYNPLFLINATTTAQGVTILPLGIAITAVDNTNGTWQYKVDNGAWTAIAGVSTTNALLLTGADAVRFVPASGTYSGSNTGGITFKAWDRTSGSAGGLVDTSSASAFSTAQATATIAVDALPTLAATGGTVTFGVGVSSSVDLFSNVSASTVEQNQAFAGARLTVTGVADATEVLTINGVDVALVNGTVPLPGLGAGGAAATVTVTVASGTATLVISGLQQADAPMSALLDGLAYKNTSANATLGNRTVSIVGLTDNGGNSGQAVTSGVSATVTVADVTAPAAPSAPDLTAGTDTGASNTDNLTGNNTPTFTGTAEANSTVTLYDTDGTTVLGTTTADNSGNWSITSSTLADGAHSLTVKATDASSNTSVASAALSVTIDTTAPGSVALSTGTVASATLTSAGATVATASATDSSAVSYSLVSGTGDTDNALFSFSGSTLVTTQGIAAGTYSLRFAATDAAGNTTVEVRTITVVNAPSIVAIARSGGASATVATGATSVSFTVTFNEAVSGVDTSDFMLTSTGTASGTVQSISGSGTTYTVLVDTLGGDGTLRLDLNTSGTGIQNGGSVAILGGYSAGQTYTLDHTAPAASSAPDLAAASDSGSSSTDDLTRFTTPTFTGTAEAGSTVTLYDTDGTTVLGTTTADNSGNWSITSSTLGEGSHTLTTKVTDAAGNVSVASAGTTVTIDTSVAAPTLGLAVDTGVAGDLRTSNGTVNVTGLENGASWEYSLDGGTSWTAGTGTSVTLSGDGAKTLTVRQTDAAGNVSTNGSLSFTLDGTAPVASSAPVLATGSDSGSSGTDRLTNVTTPTLTGTAEAGSTVTLYDTDGTTVLGTTTADNNGNWSITSSTLGEGTHTLTTQVTDVAGNVSPASTGTVITVDTTAPVAPGLALANDTGLPGDLRTSNGTVNVTGLENASSWAYSLDGTTWTPGTGTSVTLTGDGAKTIQVRQTDAAGNVSQHTTLNFIIDATAPLASPAPVLAPGSDSGSSATDRLTNVTTPTLTGTAEAGSTVTLYDTDGTTVLGTTTADNNGAWSITSSTLAAGSHTLTTKVTDAAGNGSPASPGTAITVDTTAPAAPTVALASDTGTPGDLRTSNGTVNVSGLENGASWEYSLDGGTHWTAGTGTSVTLTGDGAKTLTVRQADAAGNVSQGSTLAFVIDATAPTPSSAPVLAPGSDSGSSSSDRLTHVTTPTLTGMAEPGSTVTLYDTDGTTVLGSATADNSGNWSITSSTLATGAHTLTTKVTDEAGNVSQASSATSITIDTTAPTAPTVALAHDTGLAGDLRTSNGTVNVTGLENGASWDYSLDGGTTWTAGVGTSVTLSGDGTHAITVRQTDAAGNVSPGSTLTFVLDASAPAASSAPVLAPGSDSGSSAADGLTRITTPTLTGTAEPGSTVTLFDTDGTTVLGTATADNMGNWSITSTTLGEGLHTLTTKVTDVAGNVSAASPGTAIAIDTGVATPALSLAVDTGVAGDLRTSNGTVDVSGLEAGGTWDYSLDGGTTWSIGTGSSVSLSGDGVKTLTVRQTDAAGNVSSLATLSFTLDATAPAAPSAPVLAPGSDTGSSTTDGLTQVTTPTLTGTAEPGGTVTLFDTDGTTVLGTATVDNTGHWTLTSNVLAEGPHTLTTQVTDAASNVSARSAATVITIDTEVSAPTVGLAVDSGAIGDGRTNDGTVTIAGLEPGATWAYSTDGGTTWTAGTGSSVTLTGDGAHSLLVRQTDAAGNVSVPTPLSFTLDTTLPAAPTLALAHDTSTPGDSITADGTVIVSGLEPGATWQYSTDGGTTWLDGSGNSVGLAGNGDKAITVRQVDAAGNVSAPSATLAFSVQPDLPPPVPVVAAPAVVAPLAIPLVVSEPPPVAPPRIEFVQAAAVSGSALASPLSLVPTVTVQRTVDVVDLSGRTQLPLTTPVGPGGFRAVTLPETGQQGDALVLLRGVANTVLDPATPVDLVIPADAFGHTNPQAVVQLSLALTDGRPLPGWITFDGKTGKLHVEMPAGFQGTLDLKLTARDAQGREVTTTFRISARQTGEPARPVSSGRPGLTEKLRAAAHGKAISDALLKQPA